jgi:hypothetical protein
MKTIKEFCESNGLVMLKVNYFAQGFLNKRKGFDICRKDGVIYFSFEPVNYRKDSIYSKDKWLVRHSPPNYDGKKYLQRITKKYLKSLDLSETSGIIVNLK